MYRLPTIKLNATQQRWIKGKTKNDGLPIAYIIRSLINDEIKREGRRKKARNENGQNKPKREI